MAVWPVADYDLAGTLEGGQAFRWTRMGDAWCGVVGGRWVKVCCREGQLRAQTSIPQSDWQWLADYFQVQVDLKSILATFPQDPSMQTAVATCRGLRLLRQDAWECLASFLLSATKQIVQIRQIVALLCAAYGEPVPVPDGHPPAFAFPPPERLALQNEPHLRRLKMGFRAPRLIGAARAVAEGRLDLASLPTRTLEAARESLQQLDGVGPKIADCVLLYGCGFQEAFPIDVWVERALQELHLPGRRAGQSRLREFAAQHFGPYAGYAQQYLFHHIRSRHTPAPVQETLSARGERAVS